MRTLIQKSQNIINVSSHLDELRQRQYQNAMKELHEELKLIEEYEDMPASIKEKVKRSAKKIEKAILRKKAERN